MGCGTSKLLPDNAAIRAKIRPIIWRRIEDLNKRRRDLQKGSTPSKKILLDSDDCEKMSSANKDSLGSKSTPSENNADNGAAEIVPVVEKEEEEATTIAESHIKREENHVEVKNENGEEIKEENGGGHETELEENDDEDEGRTISPGSPSFRFYCVDSIANDTDDEHESPRKSLETETIEEHPASSKSSAEAEVQQDDLEKRNNKRNIKMKFRRVINKSGKMKCLLKVKSCYNPACVGTHGHDKAHLLEQATA